MRPCDPHRAASRRLRAVSIEGAALALQGGGWVPVCPRPRLRLQERKAIPCPRLPGGCKYTKQQPHNTYAQHVIINPRNGCTRGSVTVANTTQPAWRRSFPQLDAVTNEAECSEGHAQQGESRSSIRHVIASVMVAQGQLNLPAAATSNQIIDKREAVGSRGEWAA